MSKRVALPAAIKAIREAKAGYVPSNRSYTGDPNYGTSKFATTCLISAAHLCNIEAGRKVANEELIYRIAAHLRVPVDAISYVAAEEAVA